MIFSEKSGRGWCLPGRRMSSDWAPCPSPKFNTRHRTPGQRGDDSDGGGGRGSREVTVEVTEVEIVKKMAEVEGRVVKSQ